MAIDIGEFSFHSAVLADPGAGCKWGFMLTVEQLFLQKLRNGDLSASEIMIFIGQYLLVHQSHYSGSYLSISLIKPIDGLQASFPFLWFRFHILYASFRSVFVIKLIKGNINQFLSYGSSS